MKAPVPKLGYLASASRVSEEVEKEFISMNFTSDGLVARKDDVPNTPPWPGRRQRNNQSSKGALVPKASWAEEHAKQNVCKTYIRKAGQ